MNKITVKHFLNTSLNPKKEIGGFILEPQEGEKKRFPVYIKITYKRKTTQMKSEIEDYFSEIDELFDNYPLVISREVALIESAITYEVNKFGDGFKLKGINERISIYKESLINIFHEYLYKKFIEVLESSESEFAGLLAIPTPIVRDLGLINRAAIKLIANFQELSIDFSNDIKIYEVYYTLFATDDKNNAVVILDWLYGSNKIQTRKKFETVLFHNEEMINKGIDLIDGLVINELKKV